MVGVMNVVGRFVPMAEYLSIVFNEKPNAECKGGVSSRKPVPHTLSQFTKKERQLKD